MHDPDNEVPHSTEQIHSPKDSATTTILPGLFLNGRGVVTPHKGHTIEEDNTHWFFRPLQHCEDLDGPANAPTLDDRLLECRKRADATLPLPKYEVLTANNWHSKSQSVNSLSVLLDGPQVRFAFDPHERQPCAKRIPLHSSPWDDTQQTARTTVAECDAKRQKTQVLSHYELPSCPISSPNKRPPLKQQRIRPSHRRNVETKDEENDSPFKRLVMPPNDPTIIQRYQENASRHATTLKEVEQKLYVARQSVRLENLHVDIGDNMRTDDQFSDAKYLSSVKESDLKCVKILNNQGESAHKRPRQELSGLPSPDSVLDIDTIVGNPVGTPNNLRSVLDQSTPLIRLITAREEWLKKMRTGKEYADELRKNVDVQTRFRALGMEIVEKIIEQRWFGRGFVQKYSDSVVGLDGIVTKIPLLDYIHQGQNYLLKMIYDCNFLALEEVATTFLNTPKSKTKIQPESQNNRVLKFRHNPLLLRRSTLRDLDMLIFDHLKLQDPITHAWRAFICEPSEQQLRLVTLCSHILVEAQLSLKTTVIWEESTGCFTGDPSKPLPPVLPRPPGEAEVAAWHEKRSVTKGSWLNVHVAQKSAKSVDGAIEGESVKLVAPFDPFTKVRAQKLLRIVQREYAEKQRTDAERRRKQLKAAPKLKHFLQRLVIKRHELNHRAATSISKWLRAVWTHRDGKEIVDGLKHQRDLKLVTEWLVLGSAMATRIQCMIRSREARVVVFVKRQGKAATRIQMLTRGRQGRRKAKHQKCSRIIQCCWRKFDSKRVVAHKRIIRNKNKAALQIQRITRGILGRARVIEIRRQTGATKIQSWARGYMQRLCLARDRASCIIQAPWRGGVTRIRVRRECIRMNNAEKIQFWFRRVCDVHMADMQSRLNHDLPMEKLALGTEVKWLEQGLAKIESTLRAKRAVIFLNFKLKKFEGRTKKYSVIPTSRIQERYTKDAKKVSEESDALRQQRDVILEQLLPQREKIETLKLTVEQRINLERQLRRFKELAQPNHERVKRVGMALRVVRERELGMRRMWLAGAQIRENKRIKHLNAEQLIVKRVKARDIAQHLVRQMTQRTRIERLSARLKRQLLDQNTKRQEMYEWISIDSEDNYSEALRPYLAASRIETIVPVENAFAMFDKDNSSRISSKEFQNVCFELGLEAPRAVAKLAFENASRGDNSNGIGLTAFCVWWLCEAHSERVQALLSGMNRLSRLALHVTLKLRKGQRTATTKLVAFGASSEKATAQMRLKVKLMRMSKEERAKYERNLKLQVEKSEYAAERELKRINERGNKQVEISKRASIGLIGADLSEKQEETKNPRRAFMSDEEKEARTILVEAKFAEKEGNFDAILAVAKAKEDAEIAAKATKKAARDAIPKVVLTDEQKKQRKEEMENKMDAALAEPKEEKEELTEREIKKAQRRKEKEQQRRERGAAGGGARTRAVGRESEKRAQAKK